MTKVLHGIVHGKTIELVDDPGIADGQEVEIIVRVAPSPPESQGWGEGLRRCAGALAEEWSEKDDEILEAIYTERKVDCRREIDD